MKRFWRKILAWFGIGAMLFTQLAVASYMCPTPDNGQKTLATKLITADDAEPCRNMDQEQVNLCSQHCEQAFQSVGTIVHATIDAPVLPIIAVIYEPHTLPFQRPRSQRSLLTRNADPPLSVRHCRFQI